MLIIWREHVIAGHAVSMRFPRVVERNVEVRFQVRVQKQTYSENDYLLRYYGCLRETKLVLLACVKP
jgi:hypothetical protein